MAYWYDTKQKCYRRASCGARKGRKHRKSCIYLSSDGERDLLLSAGAPAWCERLAYFIRFWLRFKLLRLM